MCTVLLVFCVEGSHLTKRDTCMWNNYSCPEEREFMSNLLHGDTPSDSVRYSRPYFL